MRHSVLDENKTAKNAPHMGAGWLDSVHCPDTETENSRSWSTPTTEEEEEEDVDMFTFKKCQIPSVGSKDQKDKCDDCAGKWCPSLSRSIAYIN